MSFKEKLLEEWESTQELLAGLDPKSDKDAYKACADRIGSIERQIADLEKAENDLDFKAAEIDMEAENKKEDKKTEKKNRIIGFVIDSVKIVAPIAGAFIFGCISMKWEDDKINSTTAGKAAWRDILKFK
ncbi:hypothetical protein [Eubacterium ramulus]|uniref:hypothetical protein n=1 Tax=Eubacterium ramulus TaxID=39490 RepID=UPI0022E495EA|nr:hypothetical protein [Eubacterium ramulus]